MGWVDKDFITIRKLSWTQAHALPTISRAVAWPPFLLSSEAGLTTPYNSLLGGETEPALSSRQSDRGGRCLETNVNVADRFDFKTAFGPGQSHELHE